MQKIFGRKPILEALKADENIEQIIISHGTKGDIIFTIKAMAQKKGIKFTELSPVKFRQYDSDKNTQGIVALKSERQYLEFDELMGVIEFVKNPLIVILDQIQDPHNVGAILRTAECAGVNGVLITTHNSAPITETAEKISAGATSHLNICKINNLNHSIEELKKEGFWIVGSYLGENTKKYNEIDYSGKIALIVSNEEKGLRQSTAQKCDFLVEIPMRGKIQSLNVSVAAGVLLFEISKNRNSK